MLRNFVLVSIFSKDLYGSECSAKLVDIALASGKIFDGEGFQYIKESFKDGTLHLIGLLSDGGVHSRIDQVQVRLHLMNVSFFLH